MLFGMPCRVSTIVTLDRGFDLETFLPYYLTLETLRPKLEVVGCQALYRLAKPETLPGMPSRSEEPIQ